MRTTFGKLKRGDHFLLLSGGNQPPPTHHLLIRLPEGRCPGNAGSRQVSGFYLTLETDQPVELISDF